MNKLDKESYYKSEQDYYLDFENTADCKYQNNISPLVKIYGLSDNEDQYMVVKQRDDMSITDVTFYTETNLEEVMGEFKMNKEEMNRRQLSFNGWDLYEHLPECNSVMTVVYASFKDIFMFNADGLSETDKVDLVNVLISEMQSGTNFTRQIVKQCDNTYFVY